MPGGEDMTVADLLRAFRAKAPVQDTPDEAALYAGDTALPALARYPYAPDLALTLVRRAHTHTNTNTRTRMRGAHASAGAQDAHARKGAVRWAGSVHQGAG